MSQARAAVVFDFDGTLVDSLASFLAATNQLLLEKQRRPVTLMEMRTLLGGGAPRLLERVFRLTGEPLDDPAAAVERWRAHYDRHAPQCTTLFPGVVPLLSKLAAQGIALGICTGKPLASTLKLAQALGIGRFFSSMQGSDSTPTPKPHPGHLLAVLAELGVEPACAVMVGDSEQDVCMARAACVRSVYVTNGQPCEQGNAPAPDRVVECSAALWPALYELQPCTTPHKSH
jgi:phosphoglycolate phosphatase